MNLKELAIDRGSTSPRVQPRKHVLSRYVLPIVLLVGFLSLVVWAAWEMIFPPTVVTVMPVISTTAEMRQAGTPLFKAAGWIEPRPTPIRVAALAPGVVEQLLVVEDQSVSKGEAVAELVKEDARLVYQRVLADKRLREAELAEAKAALVAAETRFKQPVHLQAALGEAEATLAQIETELTNLPFAARRAEADLQTAQRVYQSKLAAQGVVAGVDIDVAKGNVDSAQALLDELQDRDESLKQQRAALVQRKDALKTQLELLADELKAKDEAKARLAAAQARVTQAEVVVAEAKLRLDRMTVRAPIDGRVFRLLATPGSRVGAASTHAASTDGGAVVTMYDPTKLQVRVDVRFEDIPKVGVEQPVEIDNPALAHPMMGTVLFTSSEADIQKNTLQVKVAISEPHPVFKPEMLVDVTFLAPEQPAATSAQSQELRLYVPEQLVQTGDAGAYLWVADVSERRAKKTRVETGVVGNNGLMEINAGVNIASRIITGGSAGLEDGDRITISDGSSSEGVGTISPSTPARMMSRLPEGAH